MILTCAIAQPLSLQVCSQLPIKDGPYCYFEPWLTTVGNKVPRVGVTPLLEASHGVPRRRRVRYCSIALTFVFQFPSLRSNLTVVDNVAVQPIFVMMQDMRSYVQIGDVWQEVLLRAADTSAEGVLRIDGRHVCRCLFGAQVRSATGSRQCTSASRMRCCSVPAARQEIEVFERQDNHYV
jgi:hypothetical protein